jgi:hypothetical protein
MLGVASLIGERLAFERNGDYLIVADATGVSIGERRIDIPNVRAVAGFGDQIWIATADRLLRTDLDGRAVGRPWSLAHVAAERRTWLPLPVGPIPITGTPAQDVTRSRHVQATAQPCEQIPAPVIVRISEVR